jgi:hypothetical protein
MPAWAAQLETTLQRCISEISARVDVLYNHTAQLRRQSVEPSESRLPEPRSEPFQQRAAEAAVRSGERREASGVSRASDAALAAGVA